MKKLIDEQIQYAGQLQAELENYKTTIQTYNQQQDRTIVQSTQQIQYLTDFLKPIGYEGRDSTLDLPSDGNAAAGGAVAGLFGGIFSGIATSLATNKATEVANKFKDAVDTAIKTAQVIADILKQINQTTENIRNITNTINNITENVNKVTDTVKDAKDFVDSFRKKEEDKEQHPPPQPTGTDADLPPPRLTLRHRGVTMRY
jgi:ABC-type transporter Mla subunit MlaD